MKLKSLMAAVLLTAAFSVYSEISFETPDLNSDNKVVFTVNQKVAGSPSYRTAFMADVQKPEEFKILTCYPERMELLSKGAVLQVRNRYGTARYSSADGSLAWISHSDVIPVESIRQVPYSVSPDGKWICYLKKTGSASSELILKNASTLAEKILVKNAAFQTNKVPVCWAPDSSIVIYEKDGQIFFCDPKAEFGYIQLTEDFRKIGNGTINSICWSGNKTLIYLDRDLVYTINSNELFTRGLYSNMVGSGIVCGRLPQAFDAEHDQFYVSPNTDKIVIIQANRVISSYALTVSGFSYLSATYSKPFTDMRGSVIGYHLFWTAKSDAILWVDMIAVSDGKKKSCVYKLNGELKPLSIFDETTDPVVSPDGKRVLFGSGENLLVYDISDWKVTGKLPGEKIISYVWKDNSVIYAGGENSVREWRLDLSGATSGVAGTLFLSSVQGVFWNNGVIHAADSAGSKIWAYNEIKNTWHRTAGPEEGLKIERTVQNGRFRVFTGSTSNGRFANALYVRRLSGKAVTTPLFLDTTVKTPVRKRVSIIVDAADSADGLSNILAALKEYKVPATFFVNGEFIRRYPVETKQIVTSGYECGSMFYTNADLTGKGFVVDEEFIRRGLARNEDEFFETTGKELSLIWHAPMFKKNDIIVKGGAASGYRYIDCPSFNLDTTVLENVILKTGEYVSSSDIISRFVSRAKDGDVITVSTGISKGTRKDYLYENLDLLISALLDSGFEIVELK